MAVDTGYPSPSRTVDPDPVWPPPPEDLEACCVVCFVDGAGSADGPRAETLTLADFPPPLPAGLSAVPPALRSEPPALPRRPPPLPALPLPPPETAGDNARMAWLAVLFAVACASVSYSELRSGSWTALLSRGAESVAAAASPVSEPAADASGEWPDPLVALYETRADAARPIKLRFFSVDPHEAETRPRVRPTRPEPLGLAADAALVPTLERAALTAPRPRPLPAPAKWPSRPATLPPSAEPAAAPRRAAAPPPAARPTPAPLEPRPAAPDVAVLVDPVRGEEEGIRSTLRRFSTAYSRLDASAARDVWPSVDVRALERAFGGLKSQQLRFDRCNFSVDGSRARAACTGRAVFVPRIGNQSPRSTSREWTFELKKADDGWTIASARSS
jgi:hypothetical protein